MSSKFSKKKRDEIIEKLKELGASKPCPRCGNKSFIIADGYFQNTVQNDLHHTTLGGKILPTAMIVCDQCGFVSQHSLGVLGLLPESGEKKVKK